MAPLQLDHLLIGLVHERVLARGRGRRVRERLEDDLAVLAGKPVVEHRRNREVAQRAPVLAARRGVPERQEALGAPRVRFVGARPLRLDVLDVLAHGLILGAKAQNLAQERELRVGAAELAVEVCERAQRAGVLGGELQRALVRGDGALGLAEGAVGACRCVERPEIAGVRAHEALGPMLRRRSLPAGHGEPQHTAEEGAVVETQPAVTGLDLGGFGVAPEQPELRRVEVQEVHGVRIALERRAQRCERGTRQTRHVVKLDAALDRGDVVGIDGEQPIEIGEGFLKARTLAPLERSSEQHVGVRGAGGNERLRLVDEVLLVVVILGERRGEQVAPDARLLFGGAQGQVPSEVDGGIVAVRFVEVAGVPFERAGAHGLRAHLGFESLHRAE